MGFRSLWEALKIDKVTDVRKNRAALLLLFFIAAALYISEPIQSPLLEFYRGLEGFLLNGQGFPVPSTAMMITLAKQLILQGIALYFILFSALNYLEYKPEPSEQANVGAGGVFVKIDLPEDLRSRSTARIALKYYPYFLLLGVALLSIQMISVFFLMIPFYVVATMLSMTLLEQIYEERNIFQGMEASAALTKGFKFYIFVQFFILSSILSITENLLLNAFASTMWAGSLIRAFLFAYLTFAIGRLAGIVYKTSRLLHLSLGALKIGRF